MAKSASQAAPAGESATAPHRLYLVDGSGYIFRAYHALPPLTRSDGTPIGAVAGFCNMLNKLIETMGADGAVSHLAVVFDHSRKTFRDEIYPEYKANRSETPEDLIPQFPLIRDAVDAFAVPRLEYEGYEADDVIATYVRIAREHGAEVVIVSSDKDLMQLIRPGVTMFDPMKDKKISDAEVFEKFGVTPDKVVEVQALAGDSTDNVPGVPGIGVKTAAELLNIYGDLETLLARAGEIKQPKRRETLLNNADKARISRLLVQLKDDVPVTEKLDDLVVQVRDADRLVAFLQQMEFRTLTNRVAARLGGTVPAAATPAMLADPDRNRLKAPSATAIPTGRAAPGATAATWRPNRDRYDLVQDLAALNVWIAEAMAKGVVAVDTETDSLDPMRAKLVGISLATGPGRACYIPLNHLGHADGTLDLGNAGRPKQIPQDAAIAALKPMLEDSGVLKVGQNIKFDLLLFARAGINVAPIDDTMLLSYVLDAGKTSHGMDELSARHLGHDPITYDSVTGTGKNRITFDHVALETARDYAAEDADVTLCLHHYLKPRLVAEHQVTLYETIERPLIPVVAEMERTGILVDPANLAALSADFAARMVDLEAEVHRLAGQPFNLGSPKQLGEILFDKLQLPGGKKGKTGAYGTGADVLEALAAEGHELPRKLLDWRQLAKLKSTYTDSLQTEINPATKRVHTSFALAATSTGRLSSSDPNLQNIPIRTEEGRKIRRAFVAPKGHKLISADYSQIELRLLAHIADIGTLKDAFRQGIDIHALTASQVFNVPLEGMDPMVRRSAKAINFGIIYGMSAFGLAAQLGIPQRDAQNYIGAYFARYPGISAYMEETKKLAHDQGFVSTLYGRRVHLPNINTKNGAERSFLERAAINAPIQGSAADIIKRAMVKLPGALAEAGLAAKMLLQVHDELVFEVPVAELEASKALIKQVMEGAAALSVPLVVETGAGDNWGEAH